MNGLAPCSAPNNLIEHECNFYISGWGEPYSGYIWTATEVLFFDYGLNEEPCSTLPKSGSESGRGNGDGTVLLYPNPAPADGTSGIALSLAGDARVTVELTDLTGAGLYTATRDFAAGSHHLSLPTQSLAACVYIAHIAVDGVRTTQKLVIVR